MGESTQTLNAISRSIHDLLVTDMGEQLVESAADDAASRSAVEHRLDALLDAQAAPLSEEARRQIMHDTVANILGYGPIDDLLHDPAITEIMINGPDSVFFVRAGQKQRHGKHFLDADHLERVLARMLGRAGIDAQVLPPTGEVRLPDGSHVGFIRPPLAIGGTALTIRKFQRELFSLHDLIAFGTITESVAEFLGLCVRGHLNILLSGPTGSGKTTLLNVLAASIPAEERVITVEQTAELSLAGDNVVRLETVCEGAVAPTVKAAELVRNAARMHADRILVGDLCGAEALELIRLMLSGGDGVLASTVGRDPVDALERVEAMALLAGEGLECAAIRRSVALSFDVLVQLDRLRDGTRRVLSVSEVCAPDGDKISLRDIHRLRSASDLDETGRLRGRLEPTGYVPGFISRLAESGVTVPPEIFGES